MLRNKAINHERLSIKNCQLSLSGASGIGPGCALILGGLKESAGSGLG